MKWLPGVTSVHLSDGDQLGLVVHWCECRGVGGAAHDLCATLKEAIAGLERGSGMPRIAKPRRVWRVTLVF